MDGKYSLKVDVFTSALARVIFIGLSFVSSIIIARYLLPEGQGIYIAILVLPRLATLIGGFGIRSSNAYFIGKGIAPVSDIVSSSATLWLVSTVLTIVLVALGFLIQGLDEHGWLVLGFAMLVPSASILINNMHGIAMGNRWVRRINQSQSLEAICRFIFVVIFVIWLEMGVLGAVLAFLGALTIESVYCLSWLRDISRLYLRFNYQLIKSLVRKGIVFATLLTIMTLNYRVSILILEHYVTAEEIGYFAIGLIVAELFWQFPEVLGMVIFSHSTSSGDPDDISKHIWIITKKIMLLSLIGGTILSLAAPVLIPLVYSAEYQPSVEVLWALMPGIVAMIAYKILHSDLAGRGKPEVALRVFSSALIVNIALNIALIPEYGIIGAAIATSFTYIVATLYFIFMYVRITQKKSYQA